MLINSIALTSHRVLYLFCLFKIYSRKFACKWYENQTIHLKLKRNEKKKCECMNFQINKNVKFDLVIENVILTNERDHNNLR